ncbi:MAG TPA: EVE domain-containing protein [Thermoplasmata archaeon]|nr:EVE domain-containing protein [Thermoplasmata archaeon]
MVGHWLVKQEPSAYSWKNLENDRETEWNGVHSALALRHLREMRVGDFAVFYHSGDERACVGILRVVRGPKPDPDDERGSWTVRVRPVRKLRRPVPLAEIRDDPKFAGFDLLRNSRLSVMPVSEGHWASLLAHENRDVGAPPDPTEARSGRGKASASPPRGSGAKRRR